MNPTIASGSNTGTKKFHELDVRVLRVGDILEFALYTRIEGEYLVYRRESLPFTVEQENALRNNNISVLFVSSDQLRGFLDYLHDNILHMVSSVQDPEEDAPLFYHSASELTRKALRLPMARENVSTASTVVQSNLHFLGADRTAIHALMKQMDAEPTQYQKALNCCQYGLALAQAMGVRDPRELEAFGLGLLYMDLGMRQIPTHLLGKEGPLSFDEWTVIKRHPAAALQLLDGMPNVPDLTRAVVLGHQERLDGSGYPQGLRGDELSLALRIASVVDTFNALTTHSPERMRSSFEAISEMKGTLAGQFDPHILDAFIHILAEQEQKARAPR